MTDSPLVYVSVLNWNGYQKTIECLHSLACLDYRNKKVLVVDNNSVDGSKEHIRREFPSIEIICSDVNHGYAGGHRLCLDRAMQEKADLLWILNNDLVVRPNTLTELVNTYLRWGKCLCGSIQLLSTDQSRISFGEGWEVDVNGKPDYAKPVQFFGRSYHEYFSKNMRERVVSNVSGSSILIPISVVREHGFMDTSFFLYSEETEYCLRLGKIGIPSLVVPSSVVVHEIEGSYKGNPILAAVMKYYKKRNRLVRIRRHSGMRAYLRCVIAETRSCLKLLVKSLVMRKVPSAFLVPYYEYLGFRDALLNQMGKRFAPEDFLNRLF